MRNIVDVLKEVNNEIDYENEVDLIGAGVFSSLDILNVITVLEEEYDIEIPPKEIVLGNFKSKDTIWEMVKRLMELSC